MPRPTAIAIVYRSAALAALVALLALLAPAGARAGFFGGDVIDGPDLGIVRLGDLDLARDGTGAVVYVKREGVVEHVYISRLVDGLWSPPERLDSGFLGPSADPVVAAADGGRLVVAYANGGQLLTMLRPAAAANWGPTVAVGGSAQTPSIDMSTNGAAYVVWSTGSDVRAAHLARGGSSFVPVDGVLDVDPARSAGGENGRPRVAVSADGTAVATWGEAGRVYSRRLFEQRLSDSPQDLTVGQFNGHGGGTADSPDVDIRDDSSFAWVTFHQNFTDGARVLARRLVGSEFDPPIDVSGGGFGGEGADGPRVDVAARGETLFASETTGSHTPFSTLVHLDEVGAPVAPVGGQAISSQPQPAISENGDAMVAWLQSAGEPASVHGRFFHEALPAGDGTLSNPALGGVDPAAGFAAAANRIGDMAVAYVQGSGTERRIVAGAWDRGPSVFTANTTTHWRRPQPLKWSGSIDLWGPVTYTVFVDGRAAATTAGTASPPEAVVPEGFHRWRVVAADRRGQTTSTKLRELRVDGTPPLIRLRISGRRRAGGRVRLAARPVDQVPAIRRRRASKAQVQVSGIRFVRFNFGDGTPTVLGSTVTHAFRRGSFTVTITAVDRAGNRSVVTQRLRIR